MNNTSHYYILRMKSRKRGNVEKIMEFRNKKSLNLKQSQTSVFNGHVIMELIYLAHVYFVSGIMLTDFQNF